MRRRRAVLFALTLPALLAVLAAALLVALAATPGGLRLGLWAAERLVPGTLEIEAPAGTLLGPLELGRLRYATAELQVEVQDLRLRWRPRQLADGLLFIEALEIDRLHLTRRPADEPAPPPADLGLPLALRIERLSIGQLDVGPAATEADPDLELAGIEGRLASDGRHHRLESLRLATPRLVLEARGELDGRPPFALSASARVSGEERGQPVGLALEAAGTLMELAVTAKSTSERLRLDAQALLAPFDPQPLRSGRLTATELDPATWVEGAPHARLRVEAEFGPAPAGGRLVGRVTATNAAPGRLDEQRLPLRSLNATLSEEEGPRRGELRVPELDARLTAGRLTGSARWAGGQLALDARLSDVDAAAWHGSLKPTRLAGPLTLRATAAAHQLQAQLRDPRFRLELDATHADGAVRIDTLRLAAKGGSLDLAGRAVPGGEFALDGRLRDFDPAVLVALPRARLNAKLEARGQLGEAAAADLRFELGDSVFAGHPLAGRGELTLRPELLERAELALRAGDNRIEAHGRLGRAQDALSVTVAAPHLDQVGLGGALTGELVLSGRLTAPGARWTLDSPRLVLPGERQVQRLASRGRWEPETGEVEASLSADSVAPGGGLPTLAGLSAGIEGQRQRHRLHAEAKVGQAGALALAASGGLDAARLWTGTLETLAWRGEQPVRLTAPTRVEAGIGHLVLGPATLAGADWQAVLDALRWEPARLQSSGRLQGLPAALLLPQAAPATNLRLAGQWNIDFGARAEGRATLSRQSGDLVLDAGDRPLALGLDRLELAADFSGRQAALTVDAGGSRAGRLAGRLTVALQQADGFWTLARQAPWQGSLQLDTPSIAWLSPLAGAGVLLDGRLQAQVALAGSPAAPTTNGQVSGEALRLRLLDHGLDLGGGSLQLDFTPELVRLRRLELVSVATQQPREERIDFRRLTARPGRLIAEGEIAPDSGKGRIGLQAEQLAVSQLPERWVMLSGHGDARMAEGRLALAGDLRVDAAYVELAPPGQPTLSSDVVVLGREEKKKGRAPPVSMELDLDLGPRFFFQGAGVESRLAGQVRLLGDPGGQLRARGSVRTEGGSVEAYGRKLAIERGILNFQGQPDNPGLNVRALRKNLAVEAGVEVTGTVKAPQVRLVSEPDVPDTEKLSWMVLGRPPGEGLGAQDAELLLSAAMALRGSQGKGPLDSLTERLGLEELGVSSGTLAGGGRFPSSHVAGSFATDGATAAEQIATVGKRIGSNAVLSYERSLTTTESILKLTVELGRRLALVARVGANNSIGLNYSLSFGGETREAASGRK